MSTENKTYIYGSFEEAQKHAKQRVVELYGEPKA